MNILIISCVFPPEPVVSAQISNDLAVALKECGHQVTVIAPRPSRPAGFNFKTSKNEGLNHLSSIFKLVYLNSRVSPFSGLINRLLESYSFGIKSSKYLNMQAENYDLLYVNAWPIFSQFLIAKACKKFNIPYVTHIQDIYPESLSNKLPLQLGKLLNSIFLPFDKYHLRNANKVIAISENMRSHLKLSREIDAEKLIVVHNWQNEAHFTNRNICKEHHPEFTFMYLGNIGPVAGVETLIKAFHIANLQKCNLIIAGNGANRIACLDLASSLKVSNVLFKDVPEGDVALVQQQADVLLLPVIKGGAQSSIPSKLPAYMFSAKPVIATLDKNSDTAKAIMESGCGWVGPAEDEDWLAKQMIAVYNMDQEKLFEVGQKGYYYGLKYFSKKSNLAKLLKAILNG